MKGGIRGVLVINFQIVISQATYPRGVGKYGQASAPHCKPKEEPNISFKCENLFSSLKIAQYLIILKS